MRCDFQQGTPASCGGHGHRSVDTERAFATVEAVSVVIPDSVLEAAERRHLTVSQFVEKALAAQSSAVLSDPYLEARAKKATGEGWKVLDRAPDMPPQAGDELPG